MYCPNCGHKNDDDEALFCGACGCSLAEFREEKAENFQEDITRQKEVYIENEEVERVQKVKKTKKQLSPSEKKKQKIIIAEAVVLLFLIAAYVIIGSSYSSPDKIMEKYAKARKSGDWETIYDLYDVENTGFVTKDQFVSFMKEKEEDNGLVTAYKVNPSSTNNGVNQNMTMIYSTSKGSTGVQEDFVVKKNAKKRFLFFSTWSLDGGDIFENNLYIKYVPGVTMKLDGTEIKNEYLSTYNYDEESIQAYKIPVIMTGEHKLTLEDANNFIEKNEQSIDVEESEYYYVPTVKYTEEAAKQALSAAKTYVKEIYDASYAKQGIDSVEKYFTDKETAQTAYDAIIESYRYYAEDSRSMKKYSIRVNGGQADVDAQEAGLDVNVSGIVEINYQYQDFFGASQTANTSKRINDNLIVAYDNGEWKIVSISLNNYYY